MRMNSSSLYHFKVQFEDIDAGGVVHHPNYLKYLERARCDAFSQIQIPFSALLGRGEAFVIAEVQCKYLIPARLDDNLVVISRTLNVSNSSCTVVQLIAAHEHVEPLLHAGQSDFFNVPKAYFKAKLRLVCVDLQTLKPKKIAPDVLQGIGFSTALNFDSNLEV